MQWLQRHRDSPHMLVAFVRPCAGLKIYIKANIIKLGRLTGHRVLEVDAEVREGEL